MWEQIASGGFALRYIPIDFVHGLVKPFVFGGIISLTACYYGLNTKGGTEGVGIAVRRGNELMRLAVNWALFRIWENGKFTDLWLRYFPISPF